MAKSKKKRGELKRRKYGIRDSRLFVIATEGKKTEKQYFQGLFPNSRVRTVEILPTGVDNKSAPSYVLDRLDKYAREKDLGGEDILCLMVDVDRYIDQLRRICREAKQKNYCLSVSHRCFEVWLLLHLEDLKPEDKQEGLTKNYFEKRIRSITGSYNPSKLDIGPYKETVKNAIRRAKSLHPDESQYWPPSTGSHVYRIVEKILESITPL